MLSHMKLWTSGILAWQEEDIFFAGNKSANDSDVPSPAAFAKLPHDSLAYGHDIGIW